MNYRDQLDRPTPAAAAPSARTRRVPAYFTVYLLNELLSTLGLRSRH
jgi:hypothetical protein